MDHFFKDDRKKPKANWLIPGVLVGGTSSDLQSGPGGTWSPIFEELKGEWVYLNSDYTPRPDQLLLRRTSGGKLMMDKSGCLSACKQQCISCPAIIVYLKRERGSSISELLHRECIQINLNYRLLHPLLNEPEKTLHYEVWPRDYAADISVSESGYEVPMYLGSFPLPEPGEVLDISAKWQEGHYDITHLAKMRFQIFGIMTNWADFSLDKWQKVCTVTLYDGKIKVNDRTAKLQGNKPSTRSDQR